MSDILSTLARSAIGIFESELLGDMPSESRILSGGSFVPPAIYHSRYASVSRSLHSLQGMGLVEKRIDVLEDDCPRGYLRLRTWHLTDEGRLCVKQRNLTDRSLSSRDTWLTRKKEEIKKDETETLNLLAEYRKRETEKLKETTRIS